MKIKLMILPFLVLICEIVEAQNNVPSSGDVSFGVNNPQAAVHINRSSAYNNPILRLDYPWDKTNLLEINRYNTKMATIGNGGGTYAHGVINLFHHLENDSKIKVSASPLITTYFNAGNVVIGDTDSNGFKLAVNGSFFATSIKVRPSLWADFVFEPDYDLMPLNELESFIKKHKHLPNVPSEKEVVKNDIDVAKMNAILLQKIEELTLYVIELEKEIIKLKK